jgi:biopolymer transport protein ExbD
MPWQVRHQGSPRVVRDLTAPQIVAGLRDGLWEPTDEVQGPGETRWRPLEAHPQFVEVVLDLEPPRPARPPEATSLDMNALIDVCLVLLIFFILTTSYANLVQKVVPLPLDAPESKAAVRPQKVLSIKDIKASMIRLQAVADKAGKPIVRVENQVVDALATDGTGIDVAKLRAALLPYVQGADHKRELIMDARGVSWETVIQIQDAARSAGINKIHYAKVRDKSD